MHWGGQDVDGALAIALLDMSEENPKRAGSLQTAKPSAFLLDGLASLVEQLYAQSQAARWELSLECFAAALERSAKKRFASESSTPQKLHQYLHTLNLEDHTLAA